MYDSSPLSSPPASDVIYAAHPDEALSFPTCSRPASPVLSPPPGPGTAQRRLQDTEAPLSGQPAPSHSPEKDNSVTPRRSARASKPPRKMVSPPATTGSSRRVLFKRSFSASEEKPMPAKTASVSGAARDKRRKRETARWQTEFLLSNRKSPLGNCDIRAILSSPEAWTALSAEEQKQVLALFPSDLHVLHAGTDAAQPNFASLRNDDNFRHDCARYSSDLRAGFHDKDWLQEAYEAHNMRKAGFFDHFVVSEFESSWHTLLPDELRPASMHARQDGSKDEGKKEDREEKKEEEQNGQGGSVVAAVGADGKPTNGAGHDNIKEGTTVPTTTKDAL